MLTKNQEFIKQEKECLICHQVKKLIEFNDHPTGKLKKASRCKVCNIYYCGQLSKKKRLNRDLKLCHQTVLDIFPHIEIRRVVNFALKIDILDNGCWQWKGSLSPLGYGRFWENDIEYIAHRVSFCWIHPEIPIKGDKEKRMCLDHLCRNRSCVNPAHLERVTLVENVMRGVSPHSLNAKKEKCHCGNEYELNSRNSRICRHCINFNRRLKRQIIRQKEKDLGLLYKSLNPK